MSHCPGCHGWTHAWAQECPGLGEGLENILAEYARASFGQDVPAAERAAVISLAATLRQREIDPGVRWREWHSEGYWQEWYCEPPGPGLRYRVTRQYMTGEDGLMVRRIYEIMVITDAPQAEPFAGARASADSDGHARPGTSSGAGSRAASTGPAQEITTAQGPGGTGGPA